VRHDWDICAWVEFDARPGEAVAAEEGTRDSVYVAVVDVEVDEEVGIETVVEADGRTEDDTTEDSDVIIAQVALP
jgi:hypothetical protein